MNKNPSRAIVTRRPSHFEIRAFGALGKQESILTMLNRTTSNYARLLLKKSARNPLPVNLPDSIISRISVSCPTLRRKDSSAASPPQHMDYGNKCSPNRPTRQRQRYLAPNRVRCLGGLIGGNRTGIVWRAAIGRLDNIGSHFCQSIRWSPSL